MPSAKVVPALVAVALVAGLAPPAAGAVSAAHRPSRPLASEPYVAPDLRPSTDPAGKDVGASGVGDSYFPYAGNGGYDVSHYDVTVRYDQTNHELTGTTVIDATATQDLRRFNLDLVTSMKVSKLEVNGVAAKPRQAHRELRVKPADKLKNGATFTVRVTYAGTTGRPRDITGSLFGWVSTDDGAIVVSEADGAPTWFPCNDHPTDKATYDLHVTVPDEKTVVGNGDLVGFAPATDTARGDGDPGRAWETWNWSAPDEMASYLVTATIGDFEISQYQTPSGLRVLDAVDRDLKDNVDRALAKEPDIIEFFEGVFGPYPFTSVGGIIDDNKVGYALETQTRPIYDRKPGVAVVAHELAHQWFGDAVSLHSWRDIWLNEGFATYGRWLWGENAHGTTPAERFDAMYSRPADDPHWYLPPGDPGVLNLFADPVYWRGAMTLQALREKVGDDDFFEILQTWVADKDDSDGSTLEFIDVAEDVSGQQLDLFFQTWLYDSGKPTDW